MPPKRPRATAAGFLSRLVGSEPVKRATAWAAASFSSCGGLLERLGMPDNLGMGFDFPQEATRLQSGDEVGLLPVAIKEKVKLPPSELELATHLPKQIVRYFVI